MSLTTIKGIGDKTQKLYNKLGINTPEDLLFYYPTGYSIYEKPCCIDETDNRLTVSVKASVVKSGNIKIVRNLKILTATLKDEKGNIFSATWYNMPYVKNMLKLGAVYIFRGKIKNENKWLTGAGRTSNIVLEQPGIFTLEAYDKKTHEMQPVYKRTEGLSNNAIIKSMHSILDQYSNHALGIDYYDILPETIRKKYDFPGYMEAVNKIHFPKNYEDLMYARKRLSYEEFLLFIIALKRFKEHEDFIENKYVITMNEKTSSYINSLPYRLTEAQFRVLNEINGDMSGNKVMNRLVQGDVGCGKTIVALLSLMNTAFAGYQGALMAPTEVLARQHYLNILETFEKNNIELTPVLLTGSMTAAQKRNARELIESGQADIIIGTHALIQEGVNYKNLALVITDEQHRFGVKQREKFSSKGHYPHILVMSATPIPRTLAIILYGDLDISIIDTLPAHRLPIKNCVVGKEYREKAYSFIQKEVEKGHQAYVICPMVDESEMIESEDVISYSAMLKDKLDSNIRISFLHGKMRPSEKNDIMERFANGEIDVLVSTTVIEVGVNVPNATVMMVENAERFGLAGLHQIRGRVGRGDAQSYCMFICTTENQESLKKLKTLEQSNDGFFIASEDLKLRGPGDLFGIRQSGDFEFKIGDVFNDSEMLKCASEDAKNIEKLISKEEYKKIYDKASKIAMNYLNSVNL